MSAGNRIRVRMEPELTPVRLEDRRLDLREEIQVRVDSHLTALGTAGLLVLGLAILAIIVGSTLFAQGYPQTWYTEGPPGSDAYQASRALIESVLLLWGGGIVGLLLGTSMFFYGRTVLGSGRFDSFATREPLEEA